MEGEDLGAVVQGGLGEGVVEGEEREAGAVGGGVREMLRL